MINQAIICLLLIWAISLNPESSRLENQFRSSEKKSSHFVKATQSGNHDKLKSKDYVRYILVKGAHLKSIEEKLKDYGKLSAVGNTHTYTFAKSRLGDWTVIQMPDDFKDYYNYHNLVYWFLGYPPEDKNYADFVVALAIKKDSPDAYVLYNDNELSRRFNLEDGLIGVFNDDEKFTLSIPFDEYRGRNTADIMDYDDFLRTRDIDMEHLRSGAMDFIRFEIFFNEK